MNALDRFRVLWRIALGNVGRHRGKSLVVGFILAFGTCLVVVGSALVDAVDVGMRRSITQSITGHLQVHRADAKEQLALFGDTFAGVPDLGVMQDFAKVAEVIRSVPNVADVVPMGTNVAMIYTGNDLDRRLEALRQAVRQGDAEGQKVQIARVKHILKQMAAQMQEMQGIAADDSVLIAGAEDVIKAAEDAFWARFEGDPLGTLEFLENKVAPRQTAGQMLGLRFLGTDTTKFAQQFDRFAVAKGEAIPEGQRGFMFNDGYYERFVKHRVARELDRLLEKVEQGERIADDAQLKAKAEQLPQQFPRVLYQLPPDQAELIKGEIETLLGETGELSELLKAFLAVDDDTIKARHAFFYEHIAPHIELYRVPVGTMATLKTATKSGYTRSVTVKVYGTFTLSGLERSRIAGVYSLSDLVTFRDLFGMMTEARRAEIEALRVKNKVEDVARDDIEDALFGDNSELVVEPAPEAMGADVQAELPQFERAVGDQGFDPAEVTRGVTPHAAVVLEDPEKQFETALALQQAFRDAGLELTVVGWQEAAGLMGQAVRVIRVILYATVFILLIVALVIINNSMVMATMERVHEIGTMRAIGAQRSFITRLFLAETCALALISGLVGAGIGAGIILWLNSSGIPSTSPFTDLLYSGPALFPELTSGHITGALTLVFIFALLSTFYPARIAARISPVQAMAEG
ncbi:MAG: FtsX-like permease family protein [Bradymonadia bacterium]